VSALTIPLSQMIYFGSRAWGVGDPLFPQRLYYSEINKPYSWLATDYLALAEEENDEIVGIATIDNQTVLYAFKHGSIYSVTGR